MPKSIASSFRFHRVSGLAVGDEHNLVQSLRRLEPANGDR